MLKLSRTAIGLLTAQYKSVLRKCALFNICAAAIFVSGHAANATIYDSATDSRFQYMGMNIDTEDKAYVYGTGGYNTAELADDGSHYNSWLINYGKVYFGQNTEETKITSTVVSHKHNINVIGGDALRGGGVISSLNGKYPEYKQSTLNIYNTSFIDNSATRFTDDFGDKEENQGMAAGGAISSVCDNVEIEASSVNAFNNNYVMHFYNAAGGAIYNGSVYNYVLLKNDEGIINSSGSVTFTNNHAGNEMIDASFLSPQVQSNIFDIWKNLSDDNDTGRGQLSQMATGGAIHNEGKYYSNNDTFSGNHAIGVTAKGGAIYNDMVRDGIHEDFGGEFHLNQISSFYGNYAGQGIDFKNSPIYATIAQGGAIYNNGILEIGGEAASIDKATFGDGSNGNFAIANETAEGGAIYNDVKGRVNAIRSNSVFDGNYAKVLISGDAKGGAIYNKGYLAFQGGEFKNNKAETEDGKAMGGAIYNDAGGNIVIDVNKSTSFSNNTAQQGGAIYNAGRISGAIISNTILNFTDNQASQSTDLITLGNSIYNAESGDFSINMKDKAQIHFNTNQSVYNESSSFKIEGTNTKGDKTSILLESTLYSKSVSAKYTIIATDLILSDTGYIESTAFDKNPKGGTPVNNTALDLTNNTVMLQNGSFMDLDSASDKLSNNDFIIDKNANLRYINQDSNTDYLANTITNRGTITYYANANDSNVYIAQTMYNSSIFDAASDKLTTNIHINNLESSTGNQIIVNLYNPKDNTSASKADVIVIDSTINSGTGSATEIAFNDLKNNRISQVYLSTDDKIYFAQTQIDQPKGYDFDNTFITTAKNNDYEIKIGYDEEGTVYNWYLYRAADIDPALDPEDIALIDLPRAALEQTRSILISASRTNRGQCSCYQDNCDNSFCRYENYRPRSRFWATPIYRKGTYDKPVETDFTLKGIDFGMDYQPTYKDMFGIFGSYRNGKYENDGKGKKYFSHFGSELDITSIIGGLYYRKYFGNLYMLGAIYGGKIDVDLETKTNVKSSVDGKTAGAQGEMGYDFRVTHREVITPSIKATYNYIKFDDAEDVNGKKATFGNINNVELEAALKYEYQFNNEYQLPTTGYIKPSVIQTIATGGKVKIDDKEYDDTIENETLGRIEVGADAEIIRNFSIGAFGNYTFGSEYKAWGVGGNIKYVW